MAIREGRWDCPSCGSVGQLGHSLTCSNCGAPRPQGVHFYLPSSDAPPVVDPARLAQARAGADWVCEHCGGSARATDLACPGCGAPRGGSAEQAVHDYDTAEVPHSDAEAAAAQRAAAPAGPALAGGSKPAQRPATLKDWLIVGCTGCGGLGCLGLLLLLLAGMCGERGHHPAAPQPVRSEQPAQPSQRAQPSARRRPAADSSRSYVYNPFTRVVVADRRWTRSVPVEERRHVTHSGDELPPDAELIESHEEVVGHHQVFDHNETHSHRVSERVQVGEESYTCGQRDLGNGYFEDRTCTRPVYETQYHTETEEEPVYRSEPDYGRVYSYRVWEWQQDTLLVAERHDSLAPPWPRPRLRQGRRAGARREVLEVDLAGGSAGHWTVQVPEAQYQRLLPGDSIRIVVENSEVKHILPLWRGNRVPRAAADSARYQPSTQDSTRARPSARTSPEARHRSARPAPPARPHRRHSAPG